MRVLVLGAGVLGAAVAARVAARGHEVCVLEAAGAPVSGTSATSFAWINGNNKQPAHYQRLNADAAAEHVRLDGDWIVHNGHLEFAADPDHRARLAARLGRLTAAGYPAVELPAAEAAALEPDLRVEPDALVGWFPSEGHAYPELFVAAMLAGIQVETGCRVVAVAPGGVRLADGSTRTADRVVTCLGRHTAELHPSVPLVAPAPGNAAVGFLARTAPVPVRLSRVVTTDTVNLRPAGGGALLAQALDLDGAAAPGEPVPDAVVAAIAARVADRVGYPVRIESAVVGQRALPADGLPVVGPVDDGYVVVTHSAVTLAPLLGELVASEVCDGIEQPRLAPYRPDRVLSGQTTPARRPGQQ